MQQALFEAITPQRHRTTVAMTRKSNGQFKALKHAGRKWQTDMIAVLRKYLFHRGQASVCGKPEFTFEEFRVYAEMTGHPAPASVNAWGALPLCACRAGICKWTGRVSAGVRAESHGRLLKVWVAL